MNKQTYAYKTVETSQLITILGKGHSFDDAGVEDPLVADALNKMVLFLKTYL
jgi:hypothetical protein